MDMSFKMLAAGRKNIALFPVAGGGYTCVRVDRSFCDKSSYLMTAIRTC